MKTLISIIVAKARNNVIGCSENKLPWNIPDELKYFKKITLGKPVIMGRTTYQSLGAPLKGRTNIVLTRSGFQDESIIVCTSLEDAIGEARKVASSQSAPEIMIIGGGEIFKQAFPIADRIYLTRIGEVFEGNAYLEGFEEKEWKEKSKEVRKLLEVSKDQFLDCEFLILDKKKPGVFPALLRKFLCARTDSPKNSPCLPASAAI